MDTSILSGTVKGRESS